jgi:hypothetical protein
VLDELRLFFGKVMRQPVGVKTRACRTPEEVVPVWDTQGAHDPGNALSASDLWGRQPVISARRPASPVLAV